MESQLPLSPEREHPLASLRPLRDRVVDHDVYHQMKTVDHLRVFMEHHVFAVWDFMSLLKALQQRLTCVEVPWVPQGDALSRRLINELVLEEESGEGDAGCFLSHFELYRAAMESCGADTSRIDAFVEQIRRGGAVPTALEMANVPGAARSFVETTWEIVASSPAHAIAAAFALGREEVIPDMFRTLVAELAKRFPDRFDLLQDYLERHIRLDSDHGPMALQLLARLCGDDPAKWAEAEEGGRAALNARIELWDGVVEELVATKSQPTARPAQRDRGVDPPRVDAVGREEDGNPPPPQSGGDNASKI